VDIRTVRSVIEGLNISDIAISQLRNTRANQFYVLQSKDRMVRLVVAVKYKPPYKLTIKEIYTGL
jgi:hypothetical protein